MAGHIYSIVTWGPCLYNGTSVESKTEAPGIFCIAGSFLEMGSRFCELAVVKVCVKAALFHQLIVGTLLHNVAVVHA